MVHPTIINTTCSVVDVSPAKLKSEARLPLLETLEFGILVLNGLQGTFSIADSTVSAELNPPRNDLFYL